MRYLLCLVLLALFALTEGRAATVPGAAVFVKVVSAADDAPSDVFEQRLDGGRARVLISHAALPKSFQGRVLRAVPSPDGAVVLLAESEGVVMRNTRGGATRRVRDLNGTSLRAGDVEVGKHFGGYYWVWWRKTGAVKRLARNPGDLDPPSWSSRGELLLLHDGNGYAAPDYREFPRVFDAATGATRRVPVPKGGVLFTRWASDGSAVIVGERLNAKRSRLALISLTGKTQSLLTLPLRPLIFTAALSPDGDEVAIGDNSGFSLVNLHRGARRKLRMLESLDWPGNDDENSFAPRPWGEAAFTRDGGALAVLTGSVSGPGHLVIREELWAIAPKAAAATRLARWKANVAGDDDLYQLLGWTPDQSALLLVSQPGVSEGVGSERRRLWLRPIDATQSPQLLADTGPYGIDMSWWGGPAAPARRARRSGLTSPAPARGGERGAERARGPQRRGLSA